MISRLAYKQAEQMIHGWREACRDAGIGPMVGGFAYETLLVRFASILDGLPEGFSIIVPTERSVYMVTARAMVVEWLRHCDYHRHALELTDEARDHLVLVLGIALTTFAHFEKTERRAGRKIQRSEQDPYAEA